MATIVAICPYCRAGGVRAPQSSVGASAVCPKCKSNFTVMPSDGLPGWAKEPQSAKASGTHTPVDEPPKPIDETKPVAAMGSADVTEPSPILPFDERAKVKTKSKPKADPVPVVPEPEPHETAEPADMGLVVALGALILVGVATIVSQVPYGRFAAVGIAAVGLLGGLASLGAEGRAKIAGGIAIGLNLFVLVLVLFLPSWLNLDPWRGPASDDTLKGPYVLEHGTGAHKSLSPTDWIEAGNSSWEFKDVRVTVRSAFVGPVELRGPKDAKKTTKEPYFQLLLQVANTGVERQLDLSGWASGQSLDAVLVTDSSGKQLKLATFEDGWLPDRGKPAERVLPGKTSDVRLIFASPSAKVDSFRLQLPGAAIGMAKEEIKFRIGSSFPSRSAVP